LPAARRLLSQELEQAVSSRSMDARVKALQGFAEQRRTMRDLPLDAPAFCRHRCKRVACHRNLGFYAVIWLPEDEAWTFVEGGAWMTRPEDRPRTGTGLSQETYEGVGYVRIRCKCGRDEKLRIRKYLDLPVTAEGGELVVYL
jgi:hypothetical protein